MALSGVDVPKMQWIGNNLRENWRRFKPHAELMFSGPLKSHSEAEKCNYLFNLEWSERKRYLQHMAKPHTRRQKEVANLPRSI